MYPPSPQNPASPACRPTFPIVDGAWNPCGGATALFRCLFAIRWGLTVMIEPDLWITHRFENAETARYYEARLCQDLWGGWELVLSWGGLGSRLGNGMTVHLENYRHGLKQLESVKKRRKQRGYKIVR